MANVTSEFDEHTQEHRIILESRGKALRARFTEEFKQDLMNIHNLDAEELITECLKREIDREIIAQERSVDAVTISDADIKAWREENARKILALIQKNMKEPNSNDT